MGEFEAFLDIDQTLAGGVVKAHLRVYNERLALGMTTDEIAEADRAFPKTFDVPQIMDFRARGPEAESVFQSVRGEIRTSERVHRDFDPFPGSQEGVARLHANGGLVSYYSVRPLEVEDATLQWLDERGFINPSNVVICESPQDKLERICTAIADNAEGRRSVLVDDSFKDLVKATEVILAANPGIRSSLQRLTIVGFGIDDEQRGRILEGTIYPDMGLHTMSLPSWERPNVDRIVENIRR